MILRALKTYGMILADNGSPWFVSGAPDDAWDNDALNAELRQLKGADFEAGRCVLADARHQLGPGARSAAVRACRRAARYRG